LSCIDTWSFNLRHVQVVYKNDSLFVFLGNIDSSAKFVKLSVNNVLSLLSCCLGRKGHSYVSVIVVLVLFC
jgi:hypothetical protein